MTSIKDIFDCINIKRLKLYTNKAIFKWIKDSLDYKIVQDSLIQFEVSAIQLKYVQFNESYLYSYNTFNWTKVPLFNSN